LRKGVVDFCNYCFSVNGEGSFVFSGEIHYFRMPKHLWDDRLLKAERCFLNTVSTYIPWNWHESVQGRFDFTGDRNLDYFFELCKDLNLYIIFRPGPYICAEWDSGGFPSWLWTKRLPFRSLDSGFMNYAARWYDAICPVIRRHLVTEGGTGLMFQVENEFFWGNVPYILKLAEMAKRRGIDVPIVHNEDRYIRGTSVIDTVDLYPFPSRDALEKVEEKIELLRKEQVDKPLMVMELQGGRFRPGPSLPSWWTDVLVKTAIAKGVNAINFYMFYGGTNFGYWTAKDITTSYDYDAAIREWGELGERYWVIRLIGSFLRSFSKSLIYTGPTDGDVEFSNPRVEILFRKRGRSAFLFIRNMNEQQEKVRIRISALSPEINEEIPIKGDMIVEPRSMLIMPINHKLGDVESTLLYSTSHIFSVVKMKDRTVLVLYGREGVSGELALKTERPKQIISDFPYLWDDEKKVLRFNYTHGDGLDKFALIQLRRPIELVVTTTERAAKTWLPEFYDEEIPLISNIYFLRKWEEEEDKIRLFTELPPEETVKISMLMPRSPRYITVDGKLVNFRYDDEKSVLYFSFRTEKPPDLRKKLNGTWKMKDESPEIKMEFDDSRWELWTPGKSLEDLGFLDNGYVWYRCRFKAPEDLKNGIITVADVKDYASMYLNERFIANGRRNVTGDAGEALIKGEENVLAICVESIGHWNGPCFISDLNGILTGVYLSKEKTIKLKKWKMHRNPCAEMQLKAGMLSSNDISVLINSKDPPNKALPEYIEKEWHEIEFPIRNLVLKGDGKEEIWLRTHVDLSQKFKGKFFLLKLGHIFGAYKVYVNGVLKQNVVNPRESVTIDITDCVKFSEPNLITLLILPLEARFIEGFPEIMVYGYSIKKGWRIERGLYGQRENWDLPEFDDSNWQNTSVPNSSEESMGHKGITWYRKRFTLEENSKYVAPLRLTLDKFKSRCLIYLNGRLVGRFAEISQRKSREEKACFQRDFYLPEPWLNKENILALIVEDTRGNGGITGDVTLSPYYVLVKKVIEIGFDR